MPSIWEPRGCSRGPRSAWSSEASSPVLLIAARRGRRVEAVSSPGFAGLAVAWPGLYSACVALLAGSCQIVLLHVPRTMDEIARRAMDLADEVLLVTALDVWSLYGTRRALRGLGLEDRQSTLRVVVNQA